MNMLNPTDPGYYLKLLRSQWPKLSEAIPTAEQYALAVAHDPSVEAVILVAPNGVGHAAAKSCPVEATVWAWDELLFKPAGDWAEVAGYWVVEGQLVSVDENVPFEPSCPNCDHEDVHFQDGTWLCDCCGHSW